MATGQTATPGALQAIINALRGASGMGQGQPNSRPDLVDSYRRYVMDAQERGETPLPLPQWQQQQQSAPQR